MADDSQSCNFMHKIEYGDKFLYSFFSILFMSFFHSFLVSLFYILYITVYQYKICIGTQ